MRSQTLVTAAEQHFGVLFVVCFFAGLLVPGAERAPDWAVPLCLSVIIFTACFKVSGADIVHIPFIRAAVFYVCRFIFFPAVLYLALAYTAPSLAPPALLLALMPVGVTAPAAAAIAGSDVALVLFLVLLSSAAAPLACPLVFFALTGTSLAVEPLALARTLALVLLVPIALHLPIRLNARLSRRISVHSGMVSIVLVALTLTIVIAKQRDYVFAQPWMVAAMLLLLSAEYLCFFVFPLLLFRTDSAPRRTAFCICSGVNNNGLAMAIAFLHLNPSAVLFMVLSDIPWSIGMAAALRLFAPPPELAGGQPAPGSEPVPSEPVPD